MAYRLIRKQAEKLDSFEKGYIRMSIPFITGKGEMFFVQGYLAHPDWLAEKRSPKAWYKEHLNNGYREHDLDTGYLSRVLAE